MCINLPHFMKVRPLKLDDFVFLRLNCHLLQFDFDFEPFLLFQRAVPRLENKSESVCD